jgi:arabinose-5-phosphate isomerase
MLLPILAVVGGLILLTWSAGRFVLGASCLARGLGVAPLLIGLTIVAFGTSAPEIVVSVLAALQGNPGLAIGNAIGSNIANIGLVLGLSALVTPLLVRSTILRQEFPILLLVSLLGFVLILDGTLGRIDGLILIAGLLLLTAWLIRSAMRGLGLVVLMVSSRMLVWGSVEIAHALGVSDLVIGLTIVAIGTSLPELAASVMSALKGEHDIAIGNVIGSNMFNLLAVLGLPGLIHPAAIDPAVVTRDFPVMIGLTLLLLVLAYGVARTRPYQALRGGLPAGPAMAATWPCYTSPPLPPPDAAPTPIMNEQTLLRLGLAVIETEARAVSQLAARIDSLFAKACQHMLACRGRVVVTGMGKSGHIGGKLAATLASTGTPAFFVHPGEASHGDLGMITRDDAVIALSNSGETDELLIMLPIIKRLGVPLIAMTGNPESRLAREATVNLDVSVAREACPLGLAPTSSTTAALAMGDALAVAVLDARGFTSDDFARSHPGGRLGRRLLIHRRHHAHRRRDPTHRHRRPAAGRAGGDLAQGAGHGRRLRRRRTIEGIFTDGDLRRTLDRGLDVQRR